MTQRRTVVPIDHQPAIHEIETQASRDLPPLTLLELVAAVSEVSDSPQEVAATVTYMLRSGRVRLSDDLLAGPAAKLCG